jgi:hypothetical protein
MNSENGLPQRWLLILLSAGSAAVVVGGLTMITSDSLAAACLAAVGAFGASTLGLHHIVA